MFVCSLSAALQNTPLEKTMFNAHVWRRNFIAPLQKIKHHQDTFHSILNLIEATHNED